MRTLREACGIAVLALIIGFSVNYTRSDGLPIFLSQDTGSTQSGKIKQISIEQARAALKTGRAFFLDLRPANAFTKSHIPGAMNFPSEEIYGLLPQIDRQIPKEAEVILYGVDKEDPGPAEVAPLLQMMGYGNVKIVEDEKRGR